MQYNTVLKHDQQLHEMLILLCNHIIDLKKKISLQPSNAERVKICQHDL